MRAFNKREKIMLLVLGLLIVGVVYYFLFYTPVQARILAAEARITAAQDQMLIEQVKIAQMNMMKREIEEMKAAGQANTRALPSYNNLNMVMSELNGILLAATSFDIAFPEISDQQRLVARNVNITFTAANYATAKQIIQRLSDCIYRCTINSVDLTAEGSEGEANVRTQGVSAAVNVTFYERNESAANAEPATTETPAS